MSVESEHVAKLAQIGHDAGGFAHFVFTGKNDAVPWSEVGPHGKVVWIAAVRAVLESELLRNVTTQVLVEHQRLGSHACLCGELPLGRSFAQHQADAISARLLGERF